MLAMTDVSRLLKRGMTVRQCNAILGSNWNDEPYGGNGLHRIYEAIPRKPDPENAMLMADLYFRDKKLVRWSGQFDEIAEHVAAGKRRSGWRVV